MATNHTYTSGTYNSVNLSIITTAASNIKLLNLRNTTGGMKSLQASSYFGINGAWFNMGTGDDILNIAKNNGSFVGPNTEGQNNYVGSGAVAWNGSQLSCYSSVDSADDISFLSNSNTWGQGGIALWLGYSAWENQVRNQSGAEIYLSGNAARTAMIANMSTNQVYLIVTTNNVTTTSFRSAIQSFLGIIDQGQANNTYQGIMLDGGGSSQLKAKNSANTTINIANSSGGVYRPLTQIVALKSTT